MQTQLNLLLTAERDIISKGQAYQIAGRALTRANLREVQAQIQWYTEKIAEQSRDAGPRVRQIIPF